VNRLWRVSPEVARAVKARRPVVALETTLVTHGLPRAEGLDVAAELEEVVRRGGALPATIGVLDGHLRVGLGAKELERLASAPRVAKLNLSNVAAHMATGSSGSTTVAATIVAAHGAGIEVLATGGIGGVHREAAQTGDVSSDLTALARYPVAVVCAGAKAVLDLPRTLEALETLGVPVYGLGTDRFPAFYRRDSGLPVDHRFETPREMAAAVRAHFDLGLGSGVIVANPVPAEDEMPAAIYESSLERALADARGEAVKGRDLTPFLLERLRELTEGRSVFSNLALLRANAAVAADLAVALAGGPRRARR
jgi:pseudouridine-5'-phosphate glycosidase